jgi:MFS family permease
MLRGYGHAMTTLPLRRNREYVRWLVGDVLIDVGAGIASFAFPLVTLAVTGSAGAVGMVGLIQGIGGLIGLIPGGILADRFDRRRLRLLAATTGAVTQAVLVAVLVSGVATVPVLAGWGLERVGPVPTMLLFAAICTAAALIALLGRSVRRIPVAARWQAHAAAEGLVPPLPPEGPTDVGPAQSPSTSVATEK